MRRGEKVLNVVHLSSEEPSILEMPVARWYGLNDMYKDSDDAIKSRKDVEKELSKLEGQAAMILQKIKKAHVDGEAAVSLLRVERNLLRKFFFIMKYRGPGYFKKYCSARAEEYESEDKYSLMAYMADKGFKNPRDVWLRNLRAILEVDMDAVNNWIKLLPDLMFPEDAKMFILHAQASYMAFCTPAEGDDGFILTDNCYNIYEGPTDVEFCATSRTYTEGQYHNYHEFGLVTPKLMIVFRSCLLPETLTDSNPEIRRTRTMLQELTAMQTCNPESAKSILMDLPVAMATNSCTRVVNDRLELIPGQSGAPKARDKFSFKFWKVSTRHVDLINSVFLDNIDDCQSVVFDSKKSFRRSLESYLTSTGEGLNNMERRDRSTSASRQRCLEKLATVLKSLGSDVCPAQAGQFAEEPAVVVQSPDEIWLKMMFKLFEADADSSLVSRNPTFWKAYCTLGKYAKLIISLSIVADRCWYLGGTKDTVAKDLDQSWRLYKLWALVHDLTEHSDTNAQEEARYNVLTFVNQILPRRVWLYVKHRRWTMSPEYAMHQDLKLGTVAWYAARTKALLREEVEDDVILSKCF